MKFPQLVILALACTGPTLQGADGPYTNFIRQVQMPSGVQWDASVAASGEQNSALPLDTAGARFELWTVLSSPFTTYLLDNKFVGTYAPAAEVTFISEDVDAPVPRTRADRPFSVDIKISGLLSGATDPEASKQVKLLRHVQSYGVGGTGDGINRSQATLLSQALIAQNGSFPLSYSLTSIPGADRTKVCGEERFSVFALADGTTPEQQIASKYIQIWPVADASIAGISQNQKFRVQLPKLTLTLNDLYPESRTYAQVYRGDAKLGMTGTIVPGTSLILNEKTATSRVLLVDGYDSVFDGDGRWTFEILTITPFGVDRLAYVSFDLDRTIEIRGTFTTME